MFSTVTWCLNIKGHCHARNNRVYGDTKRLNGVTARHGGIWCFSPAVQTKAQVNIMITKPPRHKIKFCSIALTIYPVNKCTHRTPSHLTRFYMACFYWHILPYYDSVKKNVLQFWAVLTVELAWRWRSLCCQGHLGTPLASWCSGLCCSRSFTVTFNENPAGFWCCSAPSSLVGSNRALRHRPSRRARCYAAM